MLRSSEPPIYAALQIADVPVALLAGGLATRLRPITERIPKALVEVAGMPFIDHQLALLHRNGIRRVVLCLGYLGEQVQQHLGDGAAFGMQLHYSFDGERLLGTGGALRRAAALLGDACWVMYGDSYLDINYRAVLDHFHTSQALSLMTVLQNGNRWDSSNVVFRDGQLVRYNKHTRTADMDYIDYGAALLRREVLERIPADQPADLADLYTALVDEGQMVGYEVTQRFYEIGTPTGLAETQAYFIRQGTMSHTHQYLADASEIIQKLDTTAIDQLVALIVALRERGGRLFILGVGGSAANAAHAVNDFRKIVGVEAYAPTDNVAELTARTNDEGWETVFSAWLRGSRLQAADMLLILSVGGGNLEKNVSPNLVRALEYAREIGATIGGIVGRDGGYTAQVADVCVIVPTVNPRTITPHSEAFQAVIWHLLVSHPDLQAAETKWESVR